MTQHANIHVCSKNIEQKSILNINSFKYEIKYIFCNCGFWLELNHMFCIYPCASLFIEFMKIQLTINIELNVSNVNVEVSLIVCFND